MQDKMHLLKCGGKLTSYVSENSKEQVKSNFYALNLQCMIAFHLINGEYINGWKIVENNNKDVGLAVNKF